VLVLLVVVEVAAVLLDLVDAEHAGVDLLDPQVELLELAVDLALLLALRVLDPDALDVGALDNVIPLAIMLARVRLGRREEGGLVEALGVHHGHLVPGGAGLAGQRLEALLEVVEGLGPGLLLELTEGAGELEHLLLGRHRSGGGADEQRRGGDLHDEGVGASGALTMEEDGVIASMNEQRSTGQMMGEWRMKEDGMGRKRLGKVWELS
jgi:hypothetical protein